MTQDLTSTSSGTGIRETVLTSVAFHLDREQGEIARGHEIHEIAVEGDEMLRAGFGGRGDPCVSDLISLVITSDDFCSENRPFLAARLELDSW